MATRTLLNLSGGIDSAYCLYDAMRQGQSLLVHHIILKNREGRQVLEKRAVDQILAWVNRQKLPGSYTYIETAFDNGTLGYTPKDVTIWAFLTGVILSAPIYKDIDSVIVPRHVDAFGHESDPAAGEARSDRFIRAFSDTIAQRDVKILTPIGHLRKKDVIAAMPQELLKLCWWCRRPRRGGLRCRNCITCKVVDPALKALGRSVGV